MANKTNELKDKDLGKVTGGTNIADVVQKLMPYIKDYPEVYEIITAYDKGDFKKVLDLLQKLRKDHPELASIFED